MERRGDGGDFGIPNFGAYGSPFRMPLPPELPVKLPLVGPVISTHRVSNAVFTPLDDRHFHPPPPTQQNQNHHLAFQSRPLMPLQRNPTPASNADPDPDPASLTDPVRGGAGNSRNSSPPPPPPPPQGSVSVVRYRECMKNHAASMGSHVVDGCCEFMPSGEEGTAGELKCAACDCHRNFHRKEVDGERQRLGSNYYPYHPNSGNQRPPVHRHAESSSKDLNMLESSGGGRNAENPASRKRFRTKFKQEQKDQMQEFADKLGWRMQKQDEEQVQQFCERTGVKKQVFKVWMHNNKRLKKTE